MRALTAVTYLGANGAKTYADNLDGLNNSARATEKAFNTFTESQIGEIKRTQAVWDNWKQSI